MAHILIVEDDMNLGQVLFQELKSQNHDLELAADAEAAVARINKNIYDLILTDINMPVMNGEQFLSRIRGHDPFAHIPVLVVSTDASHQRIRRMLELGASGYLSKPFFPEALRSEIERVLEAHDA